MSDIRHRIGIAAPAAQVYAAVATPGGVSEWWTHSEGDEQAGGTLRVYFGRPEPTLEANIVELSPNQRVQWNVASCVVPDWVGTNVAFELKAADGGTVLLFSHTDWQAPSEYLHHSSTKWATFLLGLKSHLEGGKSNRFPDDLSISFDLR